jgi:hypothetical protein
VAVLAVLAAALVAAGCQPTTPPPPGDDQANRTEDTKVEALAPSDDARDVPLAPRFRWKLPQALTVPTHVGFRLAEVNGPGETREDQGRQIAYVSGLHDTTPTELDLFAPPGGAIRTGPIRDVTELKAGQWYRWTVTALAPGSSASGVFFFQTRPAKGGT